MGLLLHIVSLQSIKIFLVFIKSKVTYTIADGRESNIYYNEYLRDRNTIWINLEKLEYKRIK